MSEWESTKNMGNTWNPTKEANGDPKDVASEDDFIDGYYVSKKEGVGQHNANVYTIEKKGGEQYNVWGTTALNQEMDKVRQGSFIRIKWLGKLLTKAGEKKPAKQRVSTDSFHAWEIFVNSSVPPLDISVPKAQNNNAISSNAGSGFEKSTRAVIESDSGDLPF